MDDRIGKLCSELNLELKSQLLPGQLGEFLQQWTELENLLLEQARDRERRVLSVNEAINVLAETGSYKRELVYKLRELRKFRNIVVHEPKKISQEQIEERITKVQEINQHLLG